MKFFFFIFICFLSLPGLCREERHESYERFNRAFKDLKSLGYETISNEALLDQKAIKIIQRMLQDSPLRFASDEEVRGLIMEKLKGKPFETFLHKSSWLVDTFVEILKDEKALPSMLGILLKRKELINYICIWLSLVLFTWVLRKMILGPDAPFMKTLLVRLILFLVVTTLSFTIFYHMFKPQVSPVSQIFVKHWKLKS